MYYYLFCNYSFLTDDEEEVRKVTKINPEDHVIKIYADNYVQAQNKAFWLAKQWRKIRWQEKMNGQSATYPQLLGY